MSCMSVAGYVKKKSIHHECTHCVAFPRFVDAPFHYHITESTSTQIHLSIFEFSNPLKSRLLDTLLITFFKFVNTSVAF